MPFLAITKTNNSSECINSALPTATRALSVFEISRNPCGVLAEQPDDTAGGMKQDV